MNNIARSPTAAFPTCATIRSIVGLNSPLKKLLKCKSYQNFKNYIYENV